MEQAFHTMDKKDRIIIDVLKENSKLSTQQISKKTSIPITTVHHRIKKLENDGAIKKYSIVLDPKKFGKFVSAYVLITVDYKLLKEIEKTQLEITQKLKSYPDVEEASMVTGGTDILIKIRVENIDELNNFVTIYLRNIEGIEKTRTMVILNEI
jgi:Lrp/AsnC family transcriptional regulator, leucine-responsive regulatory protein